MPFPMTAVEGDSGDRPWVGSEGCESAFTETTPLRGIQLINPASCLQRTFDQHVEHEWNVGD